MLTNKEVFKRKQVVERYMGQPAKLVTISFVRRDKDGNISTVVSYLVISSFFLTKLLYMQGNDSFECLERKDLIQNN